MARRSLLAEILNFKVILSVLVDYMNTLQNMAMCTFCVPICSIARFFLSLSLSFKNRGSLPTFHTDIYWGVYTHWNNAEVAVEPFLKSSGQIATLSLCDQGRRCNSWGVANRPRCFVQFVVSLYELCRPSL